MFNETGYSKTTVGSLAVVIQRRTVHPLPGSEGVTSEETTTQHHNQGADTEASEVGKVMVVLDQHFWETGPSCGTGTCCVHVCVCVRERA